MSFSWLHYLPTRFLAPLQALPDDLFGRITEVRFRLEKPFSVTAGGKNLLLNRNGAPCGLSDALRASREDLDELLARMTNGSLYAFEDCIRMGFLPLDGGCRAGIAGSAFPDENGRPAFREITSVNLRIPRFLPDFARPLTDRLSNASGVKNALGVLVISPPAYGKTTFLRSAAWLLCSGTHPRRVGIADERNELFLPDGLCDRIVGCPKSYAVELLTRTMSPEYLVCDELGAGEEEALLAAVNAGVSLIASAHGESLEQAMRRPCVSRLVNANVFGLFVCIRSGYRLEILEQAPCAC